MRSSRVESSRVKLLNAVQYQPVGRSFARAVIAILISVQPSSKHLRISTSARRRLLRSQKLIHDVRSLSFLTQTNRRALFVSRFSFHVSSRKASKPRPQPEPTKASTEKPFLYSVRRISSKHENKPGKGEKMMRKEKTEWLINVLARVC